MSDPGVDPPTPPRLFMGEWVKDVTPTENADFPFFLPPPVLWTAQGQFLVANSEASTINRNTGVFWALLQCR